MNDAAPQGRGPARICRWFGGKKAAVSLRFDDSHPTHVEVAVPMLEELGLIGTFLVNPGNEDYQQHREAWEGAILRGGHELANHTLNHHGARTDGEADEQIGVPTALLRRLQPDRRQITFEPGGATLWLQRKPFEFFADKYHLYDVNDTRNTSDAVLSCAVTAPWFSVEAFAERLAETIAAGGWLQPHFHQIDETGHLRLPPEDLWRVLEAVVAHREEVWQAGMAAIHEYEREREMASVWSSPQGEDALLLELVCGTDPNLYLQPLTLEVDLPAGAEAATVTEAAGEMVACRIEEAEGGAVIRFEAPPREAQFEVRATGIGAAAGGRMRRVGASGAHPFVMFSDGDIAGILEKASGPVGKAMWEGILCRAESALASEPAPEPVSEDPWIRMWRELSSLRMVAFGYALTRRAEYGANGVSRLVALAREDWWYGPNSEMLNTSGAVHSMGLAYDWLHDAMSEDQRAEVRASMVEHGIWPVVAATERGDWWTEWFHCNWGAVIYGETGLAALALLGEEPEAEEWVRLSQRKVWRYLQALEEDGSWGESATYGVYAWSNAIRFADGLRRVTGEDLFDNRRLRNLARWFVGMLEPGGENFVPFSNCQTGAGGVMGILFRLAREYGDGQAQTAALEMAASGSGGTDPCSLLWYDPTVEAKPLSDLPPDTLFSGVGWALLRSSREDPQATLFGLKGGQKEWDHSHHDTNSFVLYARGKPLLVDLFYPHEIWGCLTEAHNTIMVNGKEQRGEVKVAGGRDDPEHRGAVADLVSAPWYARVVGDASLAYDPSDLTSFVREVMYLRHVEEGASPDYFVMLDDVETPRPSRLDWMVHTYGEAAYAEGRLAVTQEGAAVDVTFVSPQRLEMEASERSLEAIKVPKPFESAEVVRTIKLRPAEPAARTFFLSVLAPRAASAAPALGVEPVSGAGVLGARIAAGATDDVALFALDGPAISGGGVEAVGRSCLVRRSRGRVRGAVLHNGQRLSLGGKLLFETNSTGHAVLTFGDDGVEAKLDLYDSERVWVRVDRAPSLVWVDGEERDFEYDDAAECVRLDGYGIHVLRIEYR